MTDRLTRAVHTPLVLALLVLTLLGAAGAQDRPATIADALHDTPEASVLTALFEESGLLEVFEQSGRFTFFAPSDTALARLDPEILEMMRRDRGVLDLVVRHHTIMGASPLRALRGMDALTTLEATHLTVFDDGRGVRVDGVRLANEGVETGNGVLYLVDRVLLPQSAWFEKDVLAGPNPR